MTAPGDACVTVALDAQEANAVVYAIAFELTTEAGELEYCEVSTVPGDLGRLGGSARRIARLTELNDQLNWRAHWGPIGGQPPTVEVSERVLLDVAAVLEKRARDQREHPDDCAESFAFDEAARTVARAFAEGRAAYEQR
jgi:hypothetical protein